MLGFQLANFLPWTQHYKQQKMMQQGYGGYGGGGYTTAPPSAYGGSPMGMSGGSSGGLGFGFGSMDYVLVAAVLGGGYYLMTNKPAPAKGARKRR